MNPARFVKTRTIAAILVVMGITGGGVQAQVIESTWNINEQSVNIQRVALESNVLTIMMETEHSTVHVVKNGENLWTIARQYGVTADQLANVNHKQDDSLLHPGDQLKIPLPAQSRSVVASRAGAMVFRWPTYGELSSPFGRRWGKFHEGIDIANDVGTPIVAARHGKVTFAGWCQGYGKTVIIDHGQGVETLYGHTNTILVDKDQVVKTGEIIAIMGNTGHSTGPHLHFGVYVHDKPVDPMKYLR